ncbi:MAG: rhodanese-like domain-containing protein [Rhizomicrobium sp.]
MSIPVETTASVRARLAANDEIALIDLREEGVFAEAHPLFAASLPFGRIELEVLDRLPRKAVPIIVYDFGEGLVEPAHARLRSLGYTNISALDGGLAGWRRDGGEIFRDVNTPSKAFGELVESRRHTPSLSAQEVKALIDSRENVAVLDARRFDEYQTMSIPGGISVPGGELVYRAAAVVPDRDTTIIVNCAGRTRSLIGTQSLINAGIANKVFALRNGTIGWSLAGQELEHGQSRRFAEDAHADPHTAKNGRALANRAGVHRLSIDQLSSLLYERGRTTYRFDVRTPAEYAAGHLPGFRSAPGGQLVQETDVFAPVRGARIILADDTQVRADMTGSWLAQMGWEVLVLDEDIRNLSLETGEWRARRTAFPVVPTLDATELKQLTDQGRATVFDLSSSAIYAKAHIPGAWFALRSALQNAFASAPRREITVLTADDDALPRYAAADLRALAIEAHVLNGGNRAWNEAGYPLERDIVHYASPPTDRYRRPYEGTDNPVSAMQAYLDWEYGLVAQLERDGTHRFHVI